MKIFVCVLALSAVVSAGVIGNGRKSGYGDYYYDEDIDEPWKGQLTAVSSGSNYGNSAHEIGSKYKGGFVSGQHGNSAHEIGSKYKGGFVSSFGGGSSTHHGNEDWKHGLSGSVRKKGIIGGLIGGWKGDRKKGLHDGGWKHKGFIGGAFAGVLGGGQKGYFHDRAEYLDDNNEYDNSAFAGRWKRAPSLAGSSKRRKSGKSKGGFAAVGGAFKKGGSKGAFGAVAKGGHKKLKIQKAWK